MVSQRFGNVVIVTSPSPVEPFIAEGPGVLSQPLRRSEAFRWFLIAVGGFLAGEAVSAAAVATVAAILGQSGNLAALAKAPSPPQWYVVTSLVGLWVGFIGAPVLAVNFDPIRRILGLRFSRWDLLGIPIGILSQVVIKLLYAPFMTHLHNFDSPARRLTGGSHGMGVVVMYLFVIVGAPFAEEVFFRGLLMRSFHGMASSLNTKRARRVGIVMGVIADGLLFGISHGELAQLAGLALFGILMATIFLRTGRLGMCIVAHCSFNALAIASLATTSGNPLQWL